MPAKQITLKRRSDYIMVHTTPRIKQRLQTIADERGWSLSLLCHEILQAWLEDKSLAWAEEANRATEI